MKANKRQNRQNKGAIAQGQNNNCYTVHYRDTTGNILVYKRTCSSLVSQDPSSPALHPQLSSSLAPQSPSYPALQYPQLSIPSFPAPQPPQLSSSLATQSPRSPAPQPPALQLSLVMFIPRCTMFVIFMVPGLLEPVFCPARCCCCLHLL